MYVMFFLSSRMSRVSIILPFSGIMCVGVLRYLVSMMNLYCLFPLTMHSMKSVSFLFSVLAGLYISTLLYSTIAICSKSCCAKRRCEATTLSTINPLKSGFLIISFEFVNGSGILFRYE